MMRIITGKARGVKLDTLEGLATRPTTEKVKEVVEKHLKGGKVVAEYTVGDDQ